MKDSQRKAMFAKLPDWKLKKIGEHYGDLDLMLKDARNDTVHTAPIVKKTLGEASVALGMAIDGLPEASQKIVMQKFSETVDE